MYYQQDVDFAASLLLDANAFCVTTYAPYVIELPSTRCSPRLAMASSRRMFARPQRSSAAPILASIA